MKDKNNIGKLYIVATPIGNLEDITIRALKILESVDVVAVEDTRRAKKLFLRYNIKTKMVSFYEHNEDKVKEKILKFLKEGLSVALISDAGTPSISDPGFKLIQEVRREKIDVFPIPGPSALISAFSVSGIPSNAFVFLGFLNRKKEKRRKEFEDLKTEKRSLIFYESPNRILSFIEDIIPIFGDRVAFFTREMTKKFEEYLYGNLSEIHTTLKKKEKIKGEITLVVTGSIKKSAEEIEVILKEDFKTNKKSLSEFAKEFSEKHNIGKNKIYKKILNLKKGLF